MESLHEREVSQSRTEAGCLFFSQDKICFNHDNWRSLVVDYWQWCLTTNSFGHIEIPWSQTSKRG